MIISETVLEQLENVSQSGGIKITGTKFNIKCNECSHTWGIYLDASGNLPRSWNICISCSKRKEEEKRKYLVNLSN